jgi:hypothetical protein
MTELGTIGIVGGTGQLGSALAARWARAGLKVVLGSRDAVKAAAAAGAIGHGAEGCGNRDCAARADVVVVAIPFASQRAMLAEIAPACAGKVVIDATVPLVPPRVMRAQPPPEGSAARIAQAVLGEGVSLVSAFHNVAAHKLARPDWSPDCDVLVFGDSKEAREVAVRLAAAAGLRGLHAGALDNAVSAEALTSVLIFMNRFYAVDGAGVRITGDLKTPA